MSSLINTLTKTGGPWEIRNVIHSLVSSITSGPFILSTPETCSEYFSLMKSSGFHNHKLFHSITDFLEGEISRDELIERTRSSLLNAKKKNGPSSSAQYSFEGDKDMTMEPIRRRTDPRKWRTTYKTVALALYALVILYFLQHAPSVSAEKESDLVDSAIGNVERFRVSGEIKLDTPSFDPGRRKLIKEMVPTPFLRSLDPRLRLPHNSRSSREQEEIEKDVEQFLSGTELYTSGTGYEIYTKDLSDKISDEQIADLSLWVEYMYTITNPVYTSTSSTMKVVFAHRNPTPRRRLMGNDDYLYYVGEYRSVPDTLFMKIPQEITAETYSKMGPVLVHELAHHTHLEIQYVATDCRRAYAGKMIEDENQPGLCRVHGRQFNTPESREYLMTIRDTVDGIIHLGIPNEAISYDEAIVYNKMILDMDIKVAYENALSNPKYVELHNYRDIYGMRNHHEFWAEASRSYIHSGYLSEFATRDWIMENDPDLYNLLSKVYSSVPIYEPS